MGYACSKDSCKCPFMQLLTFPEVNTLMDVQATHGQKCSSVLQPDISLATHTGSPRPARAVAKLWRQIMNLSRYLEWQAVWELTGWFSAHLYDAVRLARQLAVVERPHTHSHFHWGHAFSIAASEGSLFKLLRWCKDQIVSKITVVHTSTHQTGSWLCSRKFACQWATFFRFIWQTFCVRMRSATSSKLWSEDGRMSQSTLGLASLGTASYHRQPSSQSYFVSSTLHYYSFSMLLLYLLLAHIYVQTLEL